MEERAGNRTGGYVERAAKAETGDGNTKEFGGQVYLPAPEPRMGTQTVPRGNQVQGTTVMAHP